MALDRTGKPALAYWLDPTDAYNEQLAYWRPGEAAHKVTDTKNIQNDNPFVALTFANDHPLVAFQAYLSTDQVGTIWSVTSADGASWDPVHMVPNDGGQIGDGPFPLAATAGAAALVETIGGGNLDGTQCGTPKVARTVDFKTWTTCSPDADNSLGLDPHFTDAVFSSQGKLMLVIQNRVAGKLPAGVLFWREH